jgi:hypothetical protein
MERSAIRDRRFRLRPDPDFAALHPGYDPFLPTYSIALSTLPSLRVLAAATIPAPGS